MPTERLPHYTLFLEGENGWRTVRGSHWMTWAASTKTLISGMARVGSVRPPGWGPRDSPRKMLETMGEVVQCRMQ